MTQYNQRSPAVRRILREAKEMKEPTYEYFAQPLEENIFEWHFTIRGADKSDFAGGIYHGRIILPHEYPMKPPSIVLLTPNGRFEVNKKICLSISGHHPETWLPCWSIRTVLLALIAFMLTPADTAIGALDYTSDERKKLARKSQKWSCSHCGVNRNKLKSSQYSVFEKPKENIQNVGNATATTSSTVINEPTQVNVSNQQANTEDPLPIVPPTPPSPPTTEQQENEPGTVGWTFSLMFYNVLIVILVCALLLRFSDAYFKFRS